MSLDRFSAVDEMPDTQGSGIFHYDAYGVELDSEVQLPELRVRPEGQGVCADLVLKIRPLPPLPNEKDWCCTYQDSNGEMTLYSPGEGRFLFRGGREIVLDPHPSMKPSTLRLFILGAALNIALHQRGLWVFHGSVVCVDGMAAAFLGHPHAGKTTIAAALHGRGHTLLSDDVLVLDLTTRRPLALPGFPRFKLWPDSAQALNVAIEALPRIRDDTDKRSCGVARRFREDPAPLERMYILETASKPGITPLDAKQAQLALMPHWDLSKFGWGFLKDRRLGECFRQSGELAKCVPVRTLTRSASLGDLSRLVDLVEADLPAAV